MVIRDIYLRIRLRNAEIRDIHRGIRLRRAGIRDIHPGIRLRNVEFPFHRDISPQFVV